MSLIIKGLDINDLSTNAYCIQVSFFTKDAFRTISVPINKVIQIPSPHGRLIDENDVKAKCVNEVFDKMGTVAITETYFGDEWADDICDVPTILEAEE